MTERIGVLFVSNGYGEDNVAAHIAAVLNKQHVDISVSGFPTVGSGRFYTECGVALAGSGIRMPSEGFVRSARDLAGDVRRGLVSETLRMGKRVRHAAAEADYIVVTGDPYLLLYTTLFTKAERPRKIFIGTLQSEWYGSGRPFKEHYSILERLWLRLFCGLAIARDAKTAAYLQEKGVRHAVSFGNPMMDCFAVPQARIFPGDRTVIGILPGSKQEAYANFGTIIETVEALMTRSGKKQNYLFAVAISPHLAVEELQKRFGLRQAGPCKYDPAFSVYRTKDRGIELHVTSRRFGGVIEEADLVIGLSGTGNEQAAGLGKPVVGFWGEGPQITRKFMEAQKRLLGVSLFLCPPDPVTVARRIEEVLEDKGLLQSVSNNGRERMGGTGSVTSIARRIEEYISRS